jgi:hypothetical protein
MDLEISAVIEWPMDHMVSTVHELPLMDHRVSTVLELPSMDHRVSTVLELPSMDHGVSIVCVFLLININVIKA